MDRNARILDTSHRAIVGSAIVRYLHSGGYTNIVRRKRAVHGLLAQAKPDYVFMAATRVGGIRDNNLYRAEFFCQNLMIAANLIHDAHVAGVQRLMFRGSSCIYPRDCPQPIRVHRHESCAPPG